MSKLVFIDDYGLLGKNFYWYKYDAHGITKEEIIGVGLTDDRVQVSEDMIAPLKRVDQEFQKRGMRLYIKEGYRSPELYQLIYRKRVLKYGKEETESLFNLKDMPHASGLAVDVALWDPATDKEIYMRNGADGAPALFIDFYNNNNDEAGRHYQELQEYVRRIMFANGFRLGTKREYFHFDYKPDNPENY